MLFFAAYRPLVVLVLFLLLSATPPSIGAQPASGPPHAMEVTVRLGPQEVPGQIDLVETNDGLQGRLQISIDPPLYFALRLKETEKAQYTFYTSSPATELRLTVSADSVSGTLSLTGNRTATLQGTVRTEASVPSDLATTFSRPPFYPDVLSTPDQGEAFPTVTPDRQTLYFTRFGQDFGTQTIMVAERDGTHWRTPTKASFSVENHDRSPAVSPDGQHVFFASTRAQSSTETAASVYALWRMSRTAEGTWDAPRPIPLADSVNNYQPTVTNDGTLYFTSERADGHGGQDLYRAAPDGNGYSAAENLGPPVNTSGSEMSSVVDPEGRFLIFSSSTPHEGHVGNEDLYVSFFREGAWTSPRNLGPSVNSFANEYGPALSPDGAALYFSSDRRPPGDLYRVATDELALTP